MLLGISPELIYIYIYLFIFGGVLKHIVVGFVLVAGGGVLKKSDLLKWLVSFWAYFAMIFKAWTQF